MSTFTSDRLTEPKNIPDELKAPNIDVSDKEFTAYLDSLDNLCLLEASTLKRKIDDAIHQWKLCKDALSKIGTADIDSKLNNAIIEANVLESVNVNTAEEFTDDYERSVDRLQQVSDKLLKIIDDHKGELDSTVFMTKQMITIVEKKIASLNHNAPNYRRDLKAAETIKQTFEDRLNGGFENLRFLSNKLDFYFIAHRKEISRSFREEAKLIKENQKTMAIFALCRQFSENSVARFMLKLNEAFSNDVDSIFVFTNFIAYVLETNKDSGKDSYAKLLFLDLVDMYNNIYDIPDRDPADYLKDLNDLFRRKIQLFCSTRKLSIHNKKDAIHFKPTFGFNN